MKFGAKIIDGIIAQKLFHAQCSQCGSDAVTVVWSSAADEQIEAMAAGESVPEGTNTMAIRFLMDNPHMTVADLHDATRRLVSQGAGNVSVVIERTGPLSWAQLAERSGDLALVLRGSPSLLQKCADDNDANT
jgi:hypothetical protein